ncbi:hypothetical protein GCM10023347_48630 [Streptomyces chumphonensis]|uniref:Uncharacterized protein n=1 Tax=Streptomyces chumphonensis TaxID=1214925 RepID=A0A927IDU7_9ACTN|nr:hypothetical protein [Streptomyces chumphonensis]MBD3933029.1 hypothetical protein [Streptomyces chumphonensis]
MNDPGPNPVRALADGEAELAVVLRLRWDDVTALGREASRLAARLERPVTLDEAVSHRLRARDSYAPAVLDGSRTGTAPQASALGSSRSPSEQANEVIGKISSQATPAAPRR